MRKQQSKMGDYTLLLISLCVLISACTPTAGEGQRPLPTPTPQSVLPTQLPTPTPVLSPTPSLTPKSAPIVANSSNLLPPPSDCPLTPLSPKQLPGIAPVVGASPIWVTLSRNIRHLEGEQMYEMHGWPTKMAWELEPNYTSLIHIQARNLRTATLAKWIISTQFPSSKTTVTTEPVLDPSSPGHPHSAVGPDWREWGSLLLIAEAGCYSLEARWSQGYWSTVIAVGL
jgi:hypothetical protein